MYPLPVTNYYFEDENSEPVSFHVLPVQWGSDTCPPLPHEKKARRIHLRGEADSCLEKVYKPVFAWRVDILCVKPVISALSEKDTWIVLQRPRKSFESTIKPVIVTLQCLSYLIRFPEASARSMWEYLAAVFSTYESKPSESDLMTHMPLICETVEREGALAKCELIQNFISQKGTMWKEPDEDIRVRREPRLCIDDLFENVCVLCDNGGVVMCCEGRCLRSFHATVKDAGDHKCESLGFKPIEVDEVRKVDFYCKNCQHKQHQCYACGKLGSSDKYRGAEVFQCSLARCGQFYHPHCIVKYETGNSDEDLEKRIMKGESFTCPIHKCDSCKELEADTKDRELQFAVCRRCPTSYHRKCLPRDIQFAKAKNEKDTEIRAWEGLLSNRVLIYCTKHTIVKALDTPIRDHVKFPDVNDKEIAAEEKTSFQEKKKSVKPQIQVVKKLLSRRDHVKFPDVNVKEIVTEKETYLRKKRSLTSVSYSESEDFEKRRKRLSLEALHKEETAPIPPLRQLIKAANDAKTARDAKKKLISAVVKSTSRESSSSPASLDSVATSVKDRLDSAAVDPSLRESNSPPASLDSATKKRLEALVKLGTAVIRNHRDSSTHASSESTDAEIATTAILNNIHPSTHAEMHTPERQKEDSG